LNTSNGITIFSNTPRVTPFIALGKRTSSKFQSINGRFYSEFGIFSNISVSAFNTLVPNTHRAEIATESLGGKLKNIIEVSRDKVAPPIPDVITRSMSMKYTIRPINSIFYRGNAGLCTQLDDTHT